MTMLEDEIAELADPSLYEPVRFTVEEWRQMERDCEEERWGFCMRCGGHDHYARDCNVRPAACPGFPMSRNGQA